jgi:CRISPR-associated endonuclease/helicase Cas3
LIIDAVYAHHGKLFDCINTSAENEFLKKMNDHAGCKYAEIAEIFFREVTPEAEIERLFDKAAAEIGDIFPKMRLFAHFGTGMLQKLVYSALIDADRWDAFCFEAGLDPFNFEAPKWERAAEKMEEKAAGFSPNTPINEMRCKISDRCFEFAKRPAGIYRLSVPTGGGKTLSSLRYSLQFAAKNNVSHIFYVIPFRTILDQTAAEVRAVCGDDMVLEHHSGIVVEDESDKAANEKYSILTQRWDKPIVLTTLVQFMNSLYAGKSACARRMSALLNSVIIIDEVQSVPKNMISLFNEAINFLSEICNATVLLCTATQPALDSLENHSIRLSENCEIIPYEKKMLDVFKRTEAVNMTSPKGMTPAQIAELAQKISENSILIIANTTAEARKIYEHIGCKKIYLSTAKCQQHRIKLLSEIAKLVKRQEKLVVVSTQLIEAGVDLSFAAVIRVMAGIDNLVQAAGRCNRHGEFNRICKVYLVNMAEENLSRLPDIDSAKKCTKLLLAVDKDSDLLDEKSINDYYREYFKVDSSGLNPMDYVLGKTTMMNLLSDNDVYAGEYNQHHGTENMPMLRQAFKTAGDEFRVINTATTTVLTTYGEGAEYIETLQSDAPLKEKYQIIKKCAGYSVNLFDYQIKKLQENNGIHFMEEIGVWCLNDGFYNEEYGVMTESDFGIAIY